MTEVELEYYLLRAQQEFSAAEKALSHPARSSHLALAELYTDKLPATGTAPQASVTKVAV